MDGVHPPRCVEWRWCVLLLLSCPVRWCGSCPTHPIAVLASTAVMSCTVHCQVCGVRVVSVSVVFVWWGILCPLPPRRGGGWGHRGRWGGIVDGGWHGEGRAAVLLTPRRMSASPSVCWCPPCRLPCGPVKWRGVLYAVMPRVWGWVWHLALSTPLHIVRSLCIVLVSLLFCGVVFVVGGEVRWCACAWSRCFVFFFSLSSSSLSCCWCSG